VNRLRALAAAGALTTALSSAALGAGAPAQAQGSSSTGPGAVSITKTVSRAHILEDGTEKKVDERTVTLKVSQTKQLHSRQPLDVTWSGAHPTGGLSGDPNNSFAATQEYPFMLVECRGVDSSTAPLAQRLRPESCWTGTSRERNLANRDTGFGPWRLDRYEPASKRKAKVGVPDPLPAACGTNDDPGQRRLHFVTVKGVDYANDGGNPCLPEAPEMSVVDNDSQPPNTSYNPTRLDGTGGTKFTTWTVEDNASMGCGGGVACSLVAIPIMGISCDLAAKDVAAGDRPTARQLAVAGPACEATGTGTPGGPRFGGTPDIAVTGAEWFVESNWRNRITVPLDFAPLSNVCDVLSAKAGVDVYGSELVASLTTQWRPRFCLDVQRTPFKHVQVGEPQAANLLKSGNVSAAFVSDAPTGGYGRPVASVPTALTGFAIGYDIDSLERRRVSNLKLTPRLLAKLLTESYPGILAVSAEYPALSRNPIDITADPEFIALNPGIRQGYSEQAAAIANLSSDSDVVTALTRYLLADPEAKGWLYGTPDPWGMVVNPNYNINPRRKTGFSLPVNNWPLRDAFEPKKYYATGLNQCLYSNPVPFLPLIAAPASRLASISLALQFANNVSTTTCKQVQDLGAVGAKLTASGRQVPGSRFLIGITSLGDAARYDLDAAALQTYVSPDAPRKFTNSDGRTFVRPDEASLKAAGKVLASDDASGTWRLPYEKILGDKIASAAYPGTMLVSLAVPTRGLAPAEAAGLSQLVAYAAGPGQTPGLGLGQLPSGYLPITSANGLGAQHSYALAAVGAIAAQKGQVLLPSGTSPGVSPAPTASPATNPTGGSSGVPTSTGSGPAGPSGSVPGLGSDGVPPATSNGPTGPVGPSGPTARPGSGAGSGPTAATPTTLVAQGRTPATSSALAATLFPLMLVVGAIGLVASTVVSRLGRAAVRT